MKARNALLLAILLPLAARAAEPSAMIEKLIANAWLPQNVHVEWQFKGGIPGTVSGHDDWSLGEPRLDHPAGSVILFLQRSNGHSQVEKIPVSGIARVYGKSLTVVREIKSGDPVYFSDLKAVENDWSEANGEPLTLDRLPHNVIAAHALIPGRPLLTRDLKLAPRVRSGQNVEVQYVDGSVRVRLSGRAMKDGAAGELIPVSVNLNKNRQFKGTVAEDGTVQLVR